MLDIVFKPLKRDKDRFVLVRTVRYNTCHGKRITPISFQGKCQGQLWPPCEGMPRLAVSSFPCSFSDLRPLISPRKGLTVMEGKA